jgi:SAM-dependent methyltransferase
MSEVAINDVTLDRGELREAIRDEYEVVANTPELGFHFHTGRPLARMLNYEESFLEGIPEESVASFAGTGNPFSMGELKPGENVVDIGAGAGMDSLIAGKMVGPNGKVVGVDMTPAMLTKARASAAEANVKNVDFREGYGEEIPLIDNWADVAISNGVLNLMPDKLAGLREMARVLKPTGRLQIADILVQKAVPESGKQNIDLWTG